MQKMASGSLVALAGLVTSVLTAIGVTVIDHLIKLNLFTMMFWVVVPGGAGLCGFAAASGYYFAAKALHQRPSAVLLVQMVVIAALTQALIYYLEYRTMVLDNQEYASDLVSFGTYLDLILTKTHMRWGRSGVIDTGEVGTLGYWLALLQFLGFMVGGGAVYLVLKAQPTCAPCSRYLKTLVTKKDRFGGNEELADYYDGEFVHPVDSPEFAAHVGRSFPGGKAEGGDFSMVTRVLGCPSCGAQTVSEAVQVFNGREWKDVDELKRRVAMPQGVNVAHLYRVAS